MLRSQRLYKHALRHFLIAGTALAFCLASAVWMIVAFIAAKDHLVFFGLGLCTLSAFVVWVESTEGFRLRRLSYEESLYEIRQAKHFPIHN